MKALRRTAFGLLLLGAVAFLWLVGGNAYARYRARKTERAWVRSFGTLPDLLKRYPRTSTNDTARRLEGLVKPLWLDLTPKTHESLTAEAVSSKELPEKEAERLRHGISVYLTSEVEKPEAGIDPPPPEVKDFVAEYAKDVRALEAELLASPPPRWKFDAAGMPGKQPIPNIHAIMKMQRTLLGMSVVESAGQNDAAAARSLEASWKLNQTLREMPDDLCQIIALAVARLQVGVMRKVIVDSDLWRTRLAKQDFKKSFLDTELLHAWPGPENLPWLEDLESRPERKLVQRLQTFVLRPYSGVVWSQFTDGLRRDYTRIRDSPLSDRDIPEPTVGSKSSATDILLSIALPNARGLFSRVDRFVLDAELTDKILEVRQLWLQNGLQWPAAVPGIETTRFPGAKWIYSVSTRGTMSLSLSKEPHWKKSGFALPYRFTSS